MTAHPMAPVPPRRFPRWLIALLAGLVLGTLAVCAILVIGVLSLLGSRVAPNPVVAVDGQSQVTIPATWRSVTDLNQDAQLQVADPRSDQYLIVITYPRAEWGDLTLAEFAEQSIANLADVLDAPSVSAAQARTVDGLPALQYIVTGEHQQERIFYLVTFVAGTHNYYDVVAWTSAAQAERRRASLEQVAASFQEIVPAGGHAPIYDSQADPERAIAAALVQARAEDKRVLLDFGADWCPDCVVLHRRFDDPQVRPYLDAHFVVVPIYVGRWDANLAVAERYGNPIAKGIPAVVVLDPDETIVAHTGGGELAMARMATPRTILDLLTRWAAPERARG